MVYFRIILLSALIHMALLWVLSDLPMPKRNDKTDVDVVYAKPKEEQKPKEKEIVRETNLPNEAAKPVETPRFRSEHDKNVKEEMRAQKIDITQNRGGGGGQKAANQGNPEKEQQKREGEGHPLNPKFIPGQGSPGKPLTFPGVSTVGEILPNSIKVGQWTALNTERYLYYTFFARVEERVRFRWETNLRAAAEHIDPRTIAKQDWTTEIEIVLDKGGYFETAIIHQPCGLPSFDLALSSAFKAGAPYLNPPKELVQNDGKIRLRYTVTIISSPQANL